MMRAKVISWALPRNRQAADLAAVLSAHGYSVTLYQRNDGEWRPPGLGYNTVHFGVPKVLRANTPLRWVPLIKGATVSLQCLLRSLPRPCDVVVAVNYRALHPASLIAKKWNRALLVYYALEYNDEITTRRKEQELCEKYVDIIINVEKNRLAKLKSGIRREIPAFVVPNVPRKGIRQEPKGLLRAFLLEKHGVTKADRVIFFSGVYHPYSGLERLVHWTDNWNRRLHLVLLLTGPLPERFLALVTAKSERVTLIPPVSPESVYEYTRDADIGLLPYEDNSSENVRFCSPQKLFDYLACGVPFIGSQKPLIQEVAKRTGAGVSVDMTNEQQLRRVLHDLAFDRGRLRSMSENAMRGYEECYNYESLMSPVVIAISKILRAHRRS